MQQATQAHGDPPATFRLGDVPVKMKVNTLDHASTLRIGYTGWLPRINKKLNYFLVF